MRALYLASLFVALAGCSSRGAQTSAGMPDAGGGGGGGGDAGAMHANGTLDPWQMLSPMPVRRANFCAVAVREQIVVLGGNHDADGGFVRLDEVDVALAGPDGTLSAWTTAGKTPSPVQQCTVAASGNTIYLLDGIYDDPSQGSQAFSATLGADGSLSAWKLVAPLPSTVRLIGQSAWTIGDVLLALHSDTDDVTRALHASIAAGLSPWTDAAWVPEFRGAPQWAHTAGFAYVAGGYADADAGNMVLSSGWGSSVATDGTLGAPFMLPALPTPTTDGAAIGVDDWIFVVGGRDGVFSGTPSAEVWSAQAGPSGSLTAWAPQAKLPSGRTNFSVVSAGGFLYALGGASSSATDTVYAARARF